jgi:hypothetical protein
MHTSHIRSNAEENVRRGWSREPYLSNIETVDLLDEVDRLRAELGTQERVNKDLKRGADAFLDEGDRLRAVIKDAPHSEECDGGYIGFTCTCWKADAL